MWYLTNISIRALGLALLAGLALRVCRVRSASAKHAVWTVITVVMLAQVVVSAGLPALPIRILAAAPDAGIGTTLHLAPETAPPRADSHSPTPGLSWRQSVVAIYATVTIILLLRLIFGYRLTRRLARSSRPIDGLRARESEWISVPVTVGQFSPAILLPVGWREWGLVKLRAVLAHEEAHVHRADWAIGVMAQINCCIFWFHPLAWWLKRKLAALAEQACDDMVLLEAGDRQHYAQVLLEVASAMKSAQGRLVSNAVSMAKETNVQKRIDRILDETRNIPRAFGRPGWMALVLCSMPVAYVASTVQLAPAQTRSSAPAPVEPQTPNRPVKQPAKLVAQARPPSPQQIPAQSPAPVAIPYQRWLDAEVVYIIANEERRVFRQLASDEERQMFIEQFWLRRDPTPGTPENEMKEEHYRRIAYANDHFTAGIPGWETDRGMIYIKYGPPDALDTHGPAASTFPYEIWHYRGITGFGDNAEFEFVDPTMAGRFHLTRDPTEKQR